jgi:hypothetical protein
MQLSHNHILSFEGITDDFGLLPALVSLWMENGALNDYLVREYPQMSEHRKLELVGVRLSHCQFILICDVRYSRWLLVLAIVRHIVNRCSDSYGIIY